MKLLEVAVFATCLAMAMAYYPKYCDDPETPNHGGFSPDRKGHAIKDRVEFYCKDRYRLVGAKYAVCTYDKKTGKLSWSHPSPKCVAIVCPALDDIKYGQVEVTGTRQGDKANYFCNYGFTLSGNEQRVCQKDGTWSGSEPSCVPITCDDLPDPTYGSVTLTGNRVGAYANYKCDYGFQINGDNQRVCLSTGKWSGAAPVCDPILCHDLEDPQYGTVTLTGNRVGSYANYVCTSGFTLVGVSQRRCDVSGEWTEEAPNCVPILCPDLSDPEYGTVETTDNRVGDVANYKCDYGFKRNGVAQRTCQLDGTWSDDAPTCDPITCPDLDDPLYGSVDINGNRVGYMATYKCNYGFRLKGDSKRTCLSSGAWSDNAPMCEPIKCPYLEDPQYGSVTLTGDRIGSYANYVCKSGFTLEGDSQRRCGVSGDRDTSGEWSGEAPTCVPILCPDLEDPEYGTVETTDNRVGDVANYKCDYGFMRNGVAQRTCQLDGTWSDDAPTCDPITCPALPDPLYGSVDVSGNRVGYVATYECNYGFRLKGDSQRSCLSSGAWSDKAPSCEPITCCDLEDPKYGSVALTGNRIGAYANYKCNSGFKLEGGDSQRRCTVAGDRETSGEWSGEAPACVPILCPALSDPDNGNVETTDNRVGDVANYKCDYGFMRNGVAQRTCQLDGTWTDEAPTCDPITCPDLTDPEYGSVSTTGNTVGSNANYKCDYGFRIKGDKQRVCLVTGDWSGVPPTCVPILCPDLLHPLYGSVKLTGRRVGSYANYQCNKGFRLEGSDQRRCDVSGQWSGEVPKCVLIKCPNLDDPEYGSVKLSGNLPGDKASYRCKYGFKLVGVDTRTCQYNGLWTGDAPTCRRIDCGKPVAPKWGHVKYTSTHPGSSAYYSCSKGHYLKGSAVRTCSHDGVWGPVPECVKSYRGGYHPEPYH